METACDEYSDGSSTKQSVTLGTELTLVMAVTEIMTVKVKCSIEDHFKTKQKTKQSLHRPEQVLRGSRRMKLSDLKQIGTCRS